MENSVFIVIPAINISIIVLLFQALLFYMPVVVWRTLNGRSGIDINNIVEAGESFQDSQKADTRDKTLTYMTKQMDRSARSFAHIIFTDCS